MKILLITAEQTKQIKLLDTLKDHSILTASYGFEAVRQIESVEDIDIAIIDLALPNNDGLNLVKFIKLNDAYKEIIVIMLTDSAKPEEETKGFRLGADDYLRKPIHKDSMKAVIEVYSGLLKQRAVKENIAEQTSIFNAIFQQAPLGISISHSQDPLTEEEKKVFKVNPAYERITGRTADELANTGWAKITHPEDIEKEIGYHNDFLEGKIDSYFLEKRFLKPDGSTAWVNVMVSPLVLNDDCKASYICMVQDITEKKAFEQALSESERSKSVIFTHFPGMAYRCNYDNEWTMQVVSEGCHNLTGYESENLLFNRDITFNEIVAPEYREILRKEWKHAISKRKSLKCEYEIITKSQKRKWVLEMGEGIYDKKGEVVATEGIIVDISERKKMEEGLRYSNEHDNWTGLHNRRYLEKYLIHENTKREKFKKALISINLSELHALSITYGFNYHQEVVKKVAKTLSYFGSDRCSLFHISENRFLFYLKKYEDKGELNAFCDVVSDTLESLLSIEGVGGGIGVVEINSNSKPEIDTLITNTMIASEKVDDDYDRDFGYCFFDKEMETRIMREEQIKYDLTQISGGIDTDRLFLLFQPIIDLKTGKVWGFEALARLDSKELGLVSPLEFIPIAEKTKLIIPLGELIIRKSFHFLKQLRAEGYDEYNVSINISAIQLMRSDFSKNIFEIMGEMAVNPENVCIEITESIFTTNYHEINKILGELKQLGVKSAIDDFGTGYSSFAREWELNVNSLKIDRYFVNKLLSLQSLEEAITGDIISMAHKLGHLVIAEGVEEESQKEYLRSKGCDKIQGYLISKPLALGKAIEFLKSYD